MFECYGYIFRSSEKIEKARLLDSILSCNGLTNYFRFLNLCLKIVFLNYLVCFNLSYNSFLVMHPVMYCLLLCFWYLLQNFCVSLQIYGFSYSSNLFFIVNRGDELPLSYILSYIALYFNKGDIFSEFY